MKLNSLPSIDDLMSKQKHDNCLSRLRKTQSILFEDHQSKLQYKKIPLLLETVNQHISIYEWRNTIAKGIVPCLWTCILPLDQKNVLIQLKCKFYPYTLKNIIKTSLTQLIHVLKQVLIGFQILFSQFGGFDVDDECIFIDQNYRIEVWGSKQPTSNLFRLKEQTQHEFLCSILELLQNHEIRSNLTTKFNDGLQRYSQFTFNILNAYIETFIAQNQLIVGSQKSLKQILIYPITLRQFRNLNKHGQQNFSSNCIQNCQNQLISPKRGGKIMTLKNSQNELNLQFSSSRKLRRKGPHWTSPRSVNRLKDSDMTTEETQNLSESSELHSCKQDKSIQKHSGLGSGNRNEFFGFQFKCQSTKELRKTESDRKEESRQDNQKVQIHKLQWLKIQLIKRSDVLDNYTREALSERQHQESQQNYPNKSRENVGLRQYHPQQRQHQEQPRQSQNQQQGQQQISVMAFKEKLIANQKIFHTIDSLANTKNMTNSIQVQDENKRNSPIILKKLSNIKTKLYQSIMEQDFVASKID